MCVCGFLVVSFENVVNSAIARGTYVDIKIIVYELIIILKKTDVRFIVIVLALRIIYMVYMRKRKREFTGTRC